MTGPTIQSLPQPRVDTPTGRATVTRIGRLWVATCAYHEDYRAGFLTKPYADADADLHNRRQHKEGP